MQKLSVLLVAPLLATRTPGGFMGVETVVAQLRAEHRQAQAKAERLEMAIRALEKINGSRSSRRGTRRISPAARRRIATAQKARWAKWRKAKRH